MKQVRKAFMKCFKIFSPLFQFLQLHHSSSDVWFHQLSPKYSIYQMRL